MKRWKIIVLSALGVPSLGVAGLYAYMQGLGDLRTDFVRAEGQTAEAQEKGRSLLGQVLAGPTGEGDWVAFRERPVELTFRHTWDQAFLRTFFMPLEFSGQELSLLARPGSLDTRLTFLDGDWAGSARGMQGDGVYERSADGVVDWTQDSATRFQLQGYRYFFFLPFLLSEAELITFAGTQQLHGTTYDLVYVTWGRWEPHRGADQYLLWIDRATTRVDFVQSTVREMFARSVVGLALDDHREVLGIELPFSLVVLNDIADLDSVLHHIDVQGVEDAGLEGARALDVTD